MCVCGWASHTETRRLRAQGTITHDGISEDRLLCLDFFFLSMSMFQHLLVGATFKLSLCVRMRVYVCKLNKICLLASSTYTHTNTRTCANTHIRTHTHAHKNTASTNYHNDHNHSAIINWRVSSCMHFTRI